MLLALLLALTIDPVKPESAATATTTTSTEIVALTEAEAKAVEPIAADVAAAETSDVVSGFSRTVTAAGFAPSEQPQGVPLVLTNVFQKKQEPARALRFVWREHPSVRDGRNLRLDFGLKVQEVSRDPGDGPSPPFPTWQLHRFRASLDGEVFRKVQFSIEREFAETLLDDPTKKSTKSDWKDVFAEYEVSNGLQIRAGKFKVPFGLDQTAGETNLDFIYRSLGGDYLSMGRDIGGAVHGRFFKRGLNYWVGAFQHDGEHSRTSKIIQNQEITVGEAGVTGAGRVTAAVFRRFGPNILKASELGGSYAQGNVSDEGFLPNGLRGRTVVSQNTYFERMFVKGPRRRIGTDYDWVYKALGARAEYILVSDSRQQQGLNYEDLPSVRAKAWYVQGTWVVTTESKGRPTEPRKGGLGRGGYGALEVAVRFDKMGFDSEAGQDPPFRNTRAETVFPNSDNVWTFGLTYWANRWVKIQLNTIHESISDVERAPTPLDAETTKPKFWTTATLMQVEF